MEEHEQKLIEALGKIIQTVDPEDEKFIGLVPLLRQMTGCSRPEVRRFLKAMQKEMQKGGMEATAPMPPMPYWREFVRDIMDAPEPETESEFETEV